MNTTLLRRIAIAAALLASARAAAAQDGHGLVLHDGDAFQAALRARIGVERRSSGEDSEEQDVAADVARRRVGIDGRVGSRVSFQAEREVSGARPWRDVYVDYRVLAGLRLRAGHFKLPFSLEETTSAADLSFVDRAHAVDALAPGRDAGVMAHARLWHKRLEYEGGLFRHDGGHAALNHPDRVYGGSTLAGRVSLTPFGSSKRQVTDLHLGVAVAESSLPEGESNLAGHTAMDRTFFRPRTWVAGRRLRTGVELRWQPSPFVVAAEYITVADDRDRQAIDGGNLPPLTASGWYASVVWRAPRGVTPWRHSRLEAAARFDALAFGSASGTGVASTDPRAFRIADSGVRAVTFGVNLAVARHVKLQLNAAREALHLPAGSPVPAGRSWIRVVGLQLGL